MVFQEPKVEVVNIDANDNVFAAGSCTSNANATPDMQVCSTGAPHEQSCADEAFDWVD